jgi:hypothetical protein
MLARGRPSPLLRNASATITPIGLSGGGRNPWLNILRKNNDDYWSGQVDIQERAATAWIMLGDGRKPEAIRWMREAADLEDKSGKHVAMEIRLSAMRELLGELLLQANEPALALKEFESSLRSYPNRYRSFAGAAKAAEVLETSHWQGPITRNQWHS